jgi:hypothetical protein
MFAGFPADGAIEYWRRRREGPRLALDEMLADAPLALRNSACHFG